MASTYSNRLKLELMETGANANTWGNNTNTNLQTVDAFSAGYLSKSVAGSANVTLTTANADPTAESSNKVIDLNGTLTGNITVFVPQVENNYLVYNNTSGSFTLDVAATGGTGVEITQGSYSWIYCDGTNVKQASLGTNASAIVSGTLSDARLSANVNLNNASTISTGTLPNARLDQQLQDVAGLAVTDGGFIVGDGSNFVLETGGTARTSIGLGTSDDVTFNSITANGVALTAVNASNISSGTLASARLSNTITMATLSTSATEGDNVKQRVAKAWVNFNGTGTVAIRDDFNVSSITDNGTADYSINYSSNLANSNYAFTVSNGRNSANQVSVSNEEGLNVDSMRIINYNFSSSPVDNALICLHVFGDS
jgi:hypothetical protein